MTERMRFLTRLIGAVFLLLGAVVLVWFLRRDSGGPVVVVYTSVDQVFSEPVLRRFEEKTGVHVRAVYDTEETKSTGVLNRLFVFGTYLDEVLMMRNAAGTKYYYHANHLYSVHAITNASGNIVEAVKSYDAYGKPTIITGAGTDATWFTGDDVAGSVSAIGNPFWFQGHRVDPETGLGQWKHRYLSHDLGRFVSRDPLGGWTHQSLYSYDGIDPLGLGFGDVLLGALEKAADLAKQAMEMTRVGTQPHMVIYERVVRMKSDPRSVPKQLVDEYVDTISAPPAALFRLEAAIRARLKKKDTGQDTSKEDEELGESLTEVYVPAALGGLAAGHMPKGGGKGKGSSSNPTSKGPTTPEPVSPTQPGTKAPRVEVIPPEPPVFKVIDGALGKDKAVHLEVKTPAGTIEYMGAMYIDDCCLVLEGGHVAGPGANMIGVGGIRGLIRALGQSYNVKCVRVKGQRGGLGEGVPRYPTEFEVRVDP
ncbi:MAG: hypothetical protein AMXMBFR7_47860 [Planctomycetota bacterium]